MTRVREAWLKAYRSFWLVPGAGVAVAIVLGLGVPFVDELLGFEPWRLFFTFEDPQAARGLLETIATVTVSVAGITFSVTVVALQLASQQLSPRVLRTFQSDRLNQITLAVFLGTFVYALLVMASFRVEEGEVPKLSIALAVLGAVGAFLLFVAFIHNIVDALQASTMIRRMAADARQAAHSRYPAGIGAEPDDIAAAERQARERCEREPAFPVRADRAGFLVAVDGGALVARARAAEALVVQRAALGDFVLSGEALADVVGAEGGVEALVSEVRAAFTQSQQRTIDQDVAFPIRQLTDVALRGLSTSLNDPTTAENAMASVAETLITYASEKQPSPVRVDGDQEPRLLASAPDLDDLVRLGFEQVRQDARGHPLLARRLIELLTSVREAAAREGIACDEPDRQIRLVAAGLTDELTREDAEVVRRAAKAAGA